MFKKLSIWAIGTIFLIQISACSGTFGPGTHTAANKKGDVKTTEVQSPGSDFLESTAGAVITTIVGAAIGAVIYESAKSENSGETK